MRHGTDFCAALLVRLLLLILATCASGGAAQAAGITLNAASDTNVLATIAPGAVDIGRTVNIWMGATFQGSLYIRNGAAWNLHSGGPLPIAISGQQLSAATPVTVVDQLNIANLAGLDLYLGYGNTEQDMLSAPGKLAKIYTVTRAPAPSAPNVTPIIVDAGPAGRQSDDLNVPFISVTVCSPGSTTNCQTIDHIVVDTGSTGLRLIAGALAPALNLPHQRDGFGATYAECVQFADGTFLWGSVRLADVRIAGEHASSVPIQIAGDAAFPTIPGGCTGIPVNTVQAFGANGIIGLDYFREDCGSYCAINPGNGQYYVCSFAGCAGAAIAIAQQVTHPASLFPSDNNGILIQLPAIPASGATTVTGSLVFGIGTRTNNGLGAAKVLPVDTVSGFLTTSYRGALYTRSTIDSGSTVLFLPPNAGVATCSRRDFVAPGYFCPTAPQALSAINQGINGAADTVNFSVANARTLLSNTQITAYNNIAAPNSDPRSFAWGLPFFFGRSVFTAIENAGTPGGTGPYVAY